MTLDPQRVHSIFLDALEITDPDALRLFLERACGEDRPLRQQVEALLEAAAGDESKERGHEPDEVSQGATVESTVEPSRRSVIGGRYKLLEPVGEGGMGTVWLAEQTEPVKRKVALKLIKAGMDSQQVLARFQAERQALAMMDHPNIAKIFDGGLTEQGRPYFVMEYVKGLPLTEYCDQARLDLQARLHLFMSICQAVQHAHQKGIIHRDLKPSNILVSLADGQPVPKVIDFGLAKAMHQSLTEQSVFTAQGMVVGTPLYMSPEQAENSNLDIDTRADVYSLGVILYELLTGSTPLERQQLKQVALAEVMRLIKEVEPPKPSIRLSSSHNLAGIAAQRAIEPGQLKRAVSGDLDWIVMKALEKERSRRYETATGLSRDIERFLTGESVEASPPSRSYRLKKFVLRNRGMVTAASAVAFALVLGIIGFAWQTQVANDGRDRAVRAEGQTAQRAEELQKVADFQASMLKQVDPANAGRRLMQDLASRFSESLRLAPHPLPNEQQQVIHREFVKSLHLINTTDAAKDFIDRNILHPAVETIGLQFQEQPLVEAQLRQTLATVYDRIGLSEKAFQLQSLVVATRRELLGNENLDTLISISNLGTFALSIGNLEVAESLLSEALETSKRVLEPNHPSTLITVGNLGKLAQTKGQYAKAEKLHRQAYEGERAKFGADDRRTLQSALNLADSLKSLEKAEAADELLTESLERLRKIGGMEDPDTLSALNSLAMLRKAQGNFKAAEELYREGFASTRELLGEEHPETLTSLDNLSVMLADAGKLEEAIPLARSALALRRELHGNMHPGTFASINNLAGLERMLGNTAQAEQLWREVSESSSVALGPEHPNTLTSLGNLANLLSVTGRLAEAEGLLRRLLEVKQRVSGPEHESSITAMNNLGMHLRREKKLNEAEPLLRDAYELAVKTKGRANPITITLLNNLGLCYQDQGKFTETERCFRECLDLRKEVLGQDHPEVADSFHSLGYVLMNQGLFLDAEPILREAVARRKVALGEEHPETITAIGNLAFCLTKSEQYAAAEPFSRESLEKSTRILGADHPDTLTQVYNLGALLTNMEEIAEAETLLRQAWKKRSEILGPKHPNTLVAASKLGILLQDQRQFDEAQQLLSDVLTVKREILGKWHSSTLISTISLGDLLVTRDTPQAAMELLSPAEEHARTAFEQTNPAMLGQFLLQLGRAQAAVAVDAASYQLAERTLLEGHTILRVSDRVPKIVLQRCCQALVKFYTAWNAAEPDPAKLAEVQKWEEALAKLK
jgi:serine/threonine protein kinase/tetratricopeptide (TPR) repeat protein